MEIEEEILEILKKYKYDIGVYIKDMYGNEIKYNENNLFETASCIKTFILVEYFKQLYEGKISKDDYFEYTEDDNIPGLNSGIIKNFDYGLKFRSKDYAVLMITESDNIASNKLINYLGIDSINKTIKELGFKNTQLFHEINIPKYLKLATTTPYEYARLFEMLYDGKIINKKVSNDCLDILKRQEHRDMLEKYLPPLDMVLMGDDASNINYIASKSGGIVWEDSKVKNIRNDGGIISTKYGDYIISIFISNLDDLRYNFDNIGHEIGGKINELVYQKIIKNNGKLK